MTKVDPPWGRSFFGTGHFEAAPPPLRTSSPFFLVIFFLSGSPWARVPASSVLLSPTFARVLCHTSFGSSPAPAENCKASQGGGVYSAGGISERHC
jgi:hypothetical protein